MKIDNPFTLTFGRQPGKFINRYEDMANIINTFTSENSISQTYLISGVRGCGKTVLMTSVVKELCATTDWISADLNSTQDLLEDFANRLADSMKKNNLLSEAGIDISIAGFGIGLSGSKQERDSVSKIESLLEQAKKKNKRVIISIDEVTPNESMKKFASQFQIFIRKEYPVYLIMTGLYDNIYAIQNDPKLTFLLRSPKILLEPLSLHQIASQYQTIFECSEDKGRSLAVYTQGYAFAFQALGLLYWEYKDDLSFENILKKFDELLDDFAYKKIWSSLTPVEKNIIDVMTTKKEISVKEIREKLNMQSNNFSKYRERLINKGLVKSPAHGILEFTLPRFDILAKSYIAFEKE
ncbi:ATP-binding protein [Treponema sp.]|uniref:ATP-binding protein n=1 Tax=Treponema sp. TaxID=166 RepID=UPI003890E8F9